MEERKGSPHAADPGQSDGAFTGRTYGILDASPNAILATDSAGRIRYLNAQVESTFGYSSDELLGLPIEVLVSPALASRHARRRAGFRSHPDARRT